MSEQLSLLEPNQLAETEATPKLSRREQLRLIQQNKQSSIPLPTHEVDTSHYKMDESIGQIFTKYDWFNFSEHFQEKSLGGMSIEYLKQEYMKRQELREKKKDIRFFPSSIGRCNRSITYQLLHYKATPKNGSNLMVLENGTMFHERMESLFKDMGILVAPELSIKDEQLCISGRTDAVVWNFLDNLKPLTPGEAGDPHEARIELQNSKGETVYVGPEERVLLVEFKSIADKKFHDLPKTKPKLEHEMQLQLYFQLTGIKKGIIFYENKNTQQVKEYIVKRDEELISRVLGNIHNVVNLAREGKLADREFQPTDVHCRFCDYRELCHPNSNPFTFEDLFAFDEEAVRGISEEV